jgi:hypothetical protein
MPDLIKFVAKQYAIGIVMVALFAVSLLVTDMWGLGALVYSDAQRLTTAVIFVVFGVILLSPLFVGTAIFLASSGPDEQR